MSTLRINNIEAKSVPASPTLDEKIKLTNSSGDVLVHVDGKTSGITTIGINTTAGNITFDANSNVVVTGIITATKFVGTVEPTNLTVSGDLSIADSIVHTGDTDTKIRFPANDTISFETAGGNERLRIASGGQLCLGTTSGPGEIGLYLGDGTNPAGHIYANGTHHLYILANAYFAGGWKYLGNGEANLLTLQNGEVIFNSASTNSSGAGQALTWSEKLRIDSTGALRINNTRTTATKLHVVGGTASGTAYDAAVFAGGQNSTSGSGVKLYLSGCENNPTSRGVILESIMTDNSNAHRFSVKVGASSAAPTERFRLPADGRAYFFGNQSSTPNGIFGFRYDKTNDTDLSIENLNNSSVNNNAGIRLASNHGNIKARYFNNGGFYVQNSSASGYLHYFTNNVSRFYIDSSGNVNINNQGTIASSNGALGKRLGIKSTANNVIIGETTQSGNGYGLHIESRQTGRSGDARFAQIGLRNDSSGNGQITFFTAPSGGGVVERMNINSSGYVTKPAHPSFCARHNSGNGFSGDIIVLTRIENNYRSWNTGSHYSTSTGKFTAPVDGIYYFEGQLMTTGHGDGDNIQDMISLECNNGRLTYGRQRRTYFRSHADANGYYTTSTASSVNLSAGDTVWFQRKSGHSWSYSNLNYSYFTGWLIG